MCEELKMNINELAITNVTHYKSNYSKNGYVIRFKISDFVYRLYMRGEDDGIVHPNRIVHADQIDDCAYCKKTTQYCPGLTTYMQELFHRLIEFPSIRLEWLYINHV